MNRRLLLSAGLLLLSSLASHAFVQSQFPERPNRLVTVSTGHEVDANNYTRRAHICCVLPGLGWESYVSSESQPGGIFSTERI
jgi:hypothetical protein